MENQTDQDFEAQELAIQKQEKEFNEAKKVMNMLSDYVNHGKSKKAFIEAFKRDHRTLQQSMFKMFLQLMEEMATENYHTDGRNEDSKKLAQTLLEGFKRVKLQEYLSQGISEERAIEYVKTGANPSGYLPHI